MSGVVGEIIQVVLDGSLSMARGVAESRWGGNIPNNSSPADKSTPTVRWGRNVRGLLETALTAEADVTAKFGTVAGVHPFGERWRP